MTTAAPVAPLGAIQRVLSTSLVRSSSAFIVSNLLSSAAPLLLLPILTRHLSPAEFGTAAMFLLSVTLFDPLVGFSTAGAISRKYFDRREIDFSSYIGTCLFLLLGTATLLGAAILLFGDWFAATLAVPAAWLWGSLAISAGRYLVSVRLSLWQVQGHAWRYAALAFFQTLGTLSFSVWFVVGMHSGWTGRALGEVVNLCALGAIALILLIRGKWITFRFNAEHARHAFKFGAGLVPHAYGALLIAATDRFLISKYVGLDQTGLYVVGAQIAMGITVLERSFNLAWAPWLFERLKRNTAADRLLIRKITIGYNVAILGVALTLSIAAPLVLGVLAGPQYAQSAQFVFWLALGAAFTGMYKMVVNPLFYYNKTHLLAIVTFVTGAFNVVLTLFMVQRYGAIGAAQATTVSLFLSYIMTAFLAHRVARAS